MNEVASQAKLVVRLRQVLGEEKVSTDERDMEDCSRDMADYSGSALAVVKVASEEDVVNAVGIANEERVPVVARGAGSSLTGAVVPQKAIVLDMRTLNRVLKVDTINYYARVQAGVTLDELNTELEKYGFFFPPDPASSYICTVGGAISEGSGGMRCVRYGTMKDWVVAVRVVLGNGKAVRFGEPLAKNRAGYDLVHLLVGSEGTLGIITEAYLRILPTPVAVSRRMWVLFGDWESAGRAIAETRKSKIMPNMIEFLDRVTVSAVNKALQLDLEEAEATLLVDVDEKQLDSLRQIFLGNGARKISVAESAEDADRLYQARAWAYVAVKGIAPSVQVEDVVVHIDKLVEFLAWVKGLAERFEVPIPIVGHAGDGNVHPMILYDNNNPESRSRANKIFEEICRYAIRVGGSVTGEHGVGVQKIALFREQLIAHDGEESLNLMKAIKQLFDPNGILNPGKYVEAA